jgi:hypothetical protein
MRTAVSTFCSMKITYTVRGVGTRKVEWDDYRNESGRKGREVIILNEKE